MNPHIIYPPGEILKDELEARNWTQQKLAVIMGRPQQLVSGIITGRREITPETALQIAAALGTSAEMWIRMEAEYRLSLASQNASGLEQISERARLAS